jgi:SEC-C motif domain protein
MSGFLYDYCCGAVLSGRKNAATAEDLMRSRYSAYVLGDASYLMRTWHSSTRPVDMDPATFPNWCGLEIIRTEKGRADDEEGVVEFKARAISRKKMIELHEVSRFVKEAGQWLYVAGDICEDGPGAGDVGRNSPCPCGSGRKFKKCCGSS